MYVWFPVFDPRWSDMTILCNVVDAMAIAYKLLCSFSIATIPRWYGGYHRGDDEWRWSWWRYQDDGDSSLSSRNTLGNGKNRELKISNDKCQMVVAENRGWFALGDVEVEWWEIHVSKLKLPSLSSWKHLRRHKPQLKQAQTKLVKLGGKSVWWDKVMGKLWWWLMNK